MGAQHLFALSFLHFASHRRFFVGNKQPNLRAMRAIDVDYQLLATELGHIPVLHLTDCLHLTQQLSCHFTRITLTKPRRKVVHAFRFRVFAHAQHTGWMLPSVGENLLVPVTCTALATFPSHAWPINVPHGR